jgi:RNA polymerase primary sigma factor
MGKRILDSVFEVPFDGGIPHPSAEIHRPSMVNPLFKLAVLQGVDAAVRLHIERGEDINGKDDTGRPLLMLAVLRGHVGTCRILLEAGADPELTNGEGKDSLSFANASDLTDIRVLFSEYHRPTVQTDLGVDEDDLNRTPGPSENRNSFGENPDLDLFAWEEAFEGIVPVGDLEALVAAQRVQDYMSAHVAIDVDEDWTDVSIDLPLPTIASSEFDEDELTALREALRKGLRNARLPFTDLCQLSTREGHFDPDIEARILIVLGDLGIQVDDEMNELEAPEPPHSSQYPDEVEEELTDSAISFLRDLGSPASDPFNHYARDMRSRDLLSREDEQRLGRQIEEGVHVSIDAIARCTPALLEVLRLADQMEGGEVTVAEIADNGIEDPDIDDEEANGETPETILVSDGDEEETGQPGTDISALNIGQQSFRQKLATIRDHFRTDGVAENHTGAG